MVIIQQATRFSMIWVDFGVCSPTPLSSHIYLFIFELWAKIISIYPRVHPVCSANHHPHHDCLCSGRHFFYHQSASWAASWSTLWLIKPPWLNFLSFILSWNIFLGFQDAPSCCLSLSSRSTIIIEGEGLSDRHSFGRIRFLTVSLGIAVDDLVFP